MLQHKEMHSLNVCSFILCVVRCHRGVSVTLRLFRKQFNSTAVNTSWCENWDKAVTTSHRKLKGGPPRSHTTQLWVLFPRYVALITRVCHDWAGWELERGRGSELRVTEICLWSSHRTVTGIHHRFFFSRLCHPWHESEALSSLNDTTWVFPGLPFTSGVSPWRRTWFESFTSET